MSKAIEHDVISDMLVLMRNEIRDVFDKYEEEIKNYIYGEIEDDYN